MLCQESLEKSHRRNDQEGEEDGIYNAFQLCKEPAEDRKNGIEIEEKKRIEQSEGDDDHRISGQRVVFFI
jgi:hypothetical protein